MKKKVLSALMALALVLTLLPTVALAEQTPVTVSAETSSGNIKAGTENPQVMIKAEGLSFDGDLSASDFQITDAGATNLSGITSVTGQGETTATLTLSGIAHAGTLEITVQETAFTEPELTGGGKVSFTVEGVEATITAAGTITEEETQSTITLTADHDFADDNETIKNAISVNGGGMTSVTSATRQGNTKEVQVVLAGTASTSSGEVKITVTKEAFKDKDTIVTSVKDIAGITVQAKPIVKTTPTITLESEIKGKDPGGTIKVNVSGGAEFKSAGLAQGDFNITPGESGLVFSSVERTSETVATITFTGNAVANQDIKISVNNTAFTDGVTKYETPTKEATYTIKADPEVAKTTPTIEVTSDDIKADASSGTLTVKVTGSEAKFNSAQVGAAVTVDPGSSGLTFSAPTYSDETTVTVAVSGGKAVAEQDVKVTVTATAYTESEKYNDATGTFKIPAAETKKVTDAAADPSDAITVDADEHLTKAEDVVSKKLSGIQIKLTHSGSETETVTPTGWTCETYDPTNTSSAQAFKATFALPEGFEWNSAEITVTVNVTLSVVQTAESSTTPGGSGGSSGGSTTPSTPSTPSTSDTGVSQPATDAESGETRVDVSTDSTTSGTTAAATVSDANMNKAVDSAVAEAAKQGTAPVVEVEVKTSDRADSLNVTLPAAALEKLAEAEDASLVVTSDIAQVALDSAALTALAGQAIGDTVVLEVAPVAESALNEAQAQAVGEAPVVDLSLVSSGVVIHDYNGGRITVTLPYTLAQGQAAGDVVVYYMDDAGALTPCPTSYDGRAEKVTFVTTHLSKYVIGDAALTAEEACPSDQFADLDADAWYHEYTDYVIANGLMHGVDGGLFDPNGTVTRAQMVTVLWNMCGQPVVDYAMDYSDVSGEMWCAEAIRWAASEDIVDGYGNGMFGPNDSITREQMAAMLYRYEQKHGAGGFTGAWTYQLPFTDVGAISEWAFEAVAWCNMEEIITGKDNNVFDPSGAAKRCEMAAILTRFCENGAD